MSFRDRFAACNTYDLAAYRPFVVAGRRIGWIPVALLTVLRDGAAMLDLREDRVELDPALADFDARSAAMAALAMRLERGGALGTWRDERFAVATAFGAPPLFELERAAVPCFGLRAYGIHLTGFVRRTDGIWIWVPRRSRTKDTYPGMLDNTVGGGQPIGLGIVENMIKECREEAGIDEALARRAVPVGTISYCMQGTRGLQPDVQFCFDLELPDSFVPHAADGEVEAFELWPLDRVVDAVRDSAGFVPNCALVLIDFFIRHGVLAADDARDVAAFAAALRAPPAVG